MRPLIGADKSFDRHMCVDLRGGEPSVAKKLLDRTQISTTLQQVGGRGVPQAVRAEVRSAYEAGQSVVHETADDSRIDASPAFAQEERSARPLAGKHGPAALNPGGCGTKGRQPDRHHPFLAALAKHPEDSAVHLEIIDVQAAGLTDSDTRGVKKLENGVIT